MNEKIDHEEVNRIIKVFNLQVQGLKYIVMECINSGFNTADQIHNKTVKFTRHNIGFDVMLNVIKHCEYQKLIESIPNKGYTYKITPTGECLLESLKFWYSMYADINLHE